jgi:hypothetical protein
VSGESNHGRVGVRVGVPVLGRPTRGGDGLGSLTLCASESRRLGCRRSGSSYRCTCDQSWKSRYAAYTAPRVSACVGARRRGAARTEQEDDGDGAAHAEDVAARVVGGARAAAEGAGGEAEQRAVDLRRGRVEELLGEARAAREEAHPEHEQQLGQDRAVQRGLHHAQLAVPERDHLRRA